MQQEPAPTNMDTHTQMRPSCCRAKILIVDDVRTNQDVASGIAEYCGLDAHVVSNGVQAIQAVQENTFDVILMDLQMPVMDGLEATRQIRALLEDEAASSKGSADMPEAHNPGTSKHVPIIAMTALVQKYDREVCLQAGMNDYITKPVTIESLGSIMRKWLPAEKVTASTAIPGNAVHPMLAQDLSAKPPSLQSTTDSNAEIFDAESLCKRMLGNKVLIKKILDGFLGDMRTQVALLREQIELGSEGQAERQAHAIKGAAASVGANILSGIAREMELFGKAGDLAVTQERLQDLEQALNDFAEHPSCKALRETESS